MTKDEKHVELYMQLHNNRTELCRLLKERAQLTYEFAFNDDDLDQLTNEQKLVRCYNFAIADAMDTLISNTSGDVTGPIPLYVIDMGFNALVQTITRHFVPEAKDLVVPISSEAHQKMVDVILKLAQSYQDNENNK
ncbi:hypothetical protein [Photobacterium leiognathi]|uniref:hypothetical protein n=1 Tax=Photobacterium leiognathi TaxID=553611 RepID=UPI0029829E76|nr:hypothetical protein [Photobacterium leiognathi]